MRPGPGRARGAGPAAAGFGGPRRPVAMRRALVGALGAAFWLTLWQLVSMALDSPFILAGPLDTAAALLRLLPDPGFWGRIGFSFARIAGGALTGYAAAVALAAAARRVRVVRGLLAPALSAIKGTPVACVTVVLLIWFGSRNVSFIAVLLMVLPGVYFPVLKALDTLDAGRRELFWVLGAGRRQRLGALVWPGVLPYLSSASETVLGMSWKAGVAAELIGSPEGSIGNSIYQAKLLLETADLFAWTIVVVLVAWAFERLALAALRASWPAAGRWAARARRAREPEGAAASGAARDGGALVRARGLAVGHGGTAALEDVSLSVGPGEALCLMGPSGAGKTTLLRTVAGVLAPLSGELSVHGRPAMLFQDTRLVDDLTAVENVALFAGAESGIRALLAEILPADALDVPVRDLSGGQRRRVELARTICAPSAVVLLDEPFTGLDDATRREAAAFVMRHLDGRALIASTHDREDVAALGARVLAVR